jgi:hypothetical protein
MRGRDAETRCMSVMRKRDSTVCMRISVWCVELFLRVCNGLALSVWTCELYHERGA